MLPKAYDDSKEKHVLKLRNERLICPLSGKVLLTLYRWY